MRFDFCGREREGKRERERDRERERERERERGGGGPISSHTGDAFVDRAESEMPFDDVCTLIYHRRLTSTYYFYAWMLNFFGTLLSITLKRKEKTLCG